MSKISKYICLKFRMNITFKNRFLLDARYVFYIMYLEACLHNDLSSMSGSLSLRLKKSNLV